MCTKVTNYLKKLLSKSLIVNDMHKEDRPWTKTARGQKEGYFGSKTWYEK